MKTVTSTKTITVTENINVATIEDFTGFLEKRGLLYKFMRNCSIMSSIAYWHDPDKAVSGGCRSTPFVASKDPLKDFISFLKTNAKIVDTKYGRKWYEAIIIASFTWSSSPEGSATWDMAHMDWVHWLDENKIKDFEI